MPGYLGPSLSHATQLYPRIPISRVILEFPECGKGPLWFSSAIKLNPLTSLWKFRSKSAILMMVFRINLQATPASPASRSSRCDCSGPKGPSNREQTTGSFVSFRFRNTLSRTQTAITALVQFIPIRPASIELNQSLFGWISSDT